tara:strand:- start:477 stop:887 length:411 start_codon:yes stop_codon:yes gene_type:complete
MKKFLVTCFIGIFFFKTASAESPYSSLDYSWGYKDYLGAIEIKAYNKHRSKQIRFEQIKIWFSDCSLKSGEPDRIYRSYKTINSYTDVKFYIDANLPKGKKCANTILSFVEPRTFKPIKPKPKSGSQKWLDKIRGN